MKKSKDICMCLHGAGQKIVNPLVRQAFGLSEEIEKSSYADQLRQVKASLTPETWRKGAYFTSNRYSSVIDTLTAAVARLAARGATATEAAAAPAEVANNSVDYTLPAITASNASSAMAERGTSEWLHVWQKRSRSLIMDRGVYGRVDLHFLMGMFGLTATFNDDPKTTLSMIHEKLDEAIAFAEENAEFLENN